MNARSRETNKKYAEHPISPYYAKFRISTNSPNLGSDWSSREKECSNWTSRWSNWEQNRTHSRIQPPPTNSLKLTMQIPTRSVIFIKKSAISKRRIAISFTEGCEEGEEEEQHKSIGGDRAPREVGWPQWSRGAAAYSSRGGAGEIASRRGKERLKTKITILPFHNKLIQKYFLCGKI